MARKHIPGKVLARLKATPGAKMYEDTMDYMQTAYRKSGVRYDASTKEELIEAVLGKFTLIRGYHGCRPLSLESYLCDGLVLPTRKRLAQHAYAIFEGEISLAELERRADQADLTTRLGKIHFCADVDELIEECGHYLIYGPEAMNCLWEPGEPEFQRRFQESQERSRSKGIPTVLVCDVPVDWMEDCFRIELGRTLLTWHLQLASDAPTRPEDWDRNWAYAITRDLPAGNIKSHFHPERIPDPLRIPVVYCPPETRCAWCP